MADNHVNISSYRLNVSDAAVPTIADPTAPTFTEWDTVNFTFVPQVTGITITSDNRTKDISALGDGGWTRSVRERLGITMSITLEHMIDTTDDMIADGQAILATASQKIGEAGVIIVRFDHPVAAADAVVTANMNSPTEGLTTIGRFSVEGGNHGLGGGGTNASFVTSQYNLMSYGLVTTVPAS